MYRFGEKKGPLYATIKRDLLSKIERGTWPIKYRLPREDELQKQYGVSRGTVRRALSDLESEGLISRVSRRGTFVTRVTPRLEITPGDISSFTQQITRAGYEPTTTVLFAGVIKASEAEGTRVIAGFGIPADADVIRIRRVKNGNNEPFAIQSAYLLPSSCPRILEEDLTDLFKLYDEKYNRKMVAADEIIRASAASAQEACLLQLDPGAPVVIRERITYDQNREPFEVLYSVDRGDRFEYIYLIVSDATRIPNVDG